MATSTGSAYAVVLLGLTACATPAPLPAGGEATVQVQTFGGSSFVSVNVNDHTAATLFLVDTGANRTVLSPTYARRIGLTVPDDAPTRDVSIAGGHRLSVPFVRVRSVAVGPARVPDLLV